MNAENVEQRVLKVLAEQLGEHEKNIKPAHELQADLNCDSLDCVEIMMAMETEFGIEIRDSAFSELKTVQQIIDLVASAGNTPAINLFQRPITKNMNQQILFTYASRIGNAASFLDTARAALPERDKNEAGEHVEHLHDVAQILAGDRCHEQYSPEETAFEADQQYTTNLIINGSYLELSHIRLSTLGKVRLGIQVDAHPMRLTLFQDVTELRTLAAALQQLADDAESSAAQVAREQPEPCLVAQL